MVNLTVLPAEKILHNKHSYFMLISVIAKFLKTFTESGNDNKGWKVQARTSNL
jgi:hypothetical protein